MRLHNNEGKGKREKGKGKREKGKGKREKADLIEIVETQFIASPTKRKIKRRRV